MVLRNRPASSTVSSSSSSSPAVSVGGDIGTSSSSIAKRQQQNDEVKSSHRRIQLTQNPLFVIYTILRFIALICFVVGFLVRQKHLHTGIECQMTYSMREFIEIETTPYYRNNHQSYSTKATESYKLYKFIDRRDPRYKKQLQHFISNKVQPLQRHEHCIVADNHNLNKRNATTSTTITKAQHVVLFIPGHWGSYSQSRSLGAHGTRMTKARQPNIHHYIQTLKDSTTTTSTTTDANNNHLSIDKFIYDVYSVDFNEQGSALHGNFVIYQSQFVASIIKQLIEDCSVDKIHIVAHSMGGYVARYTLLQNPQLYQYVPNIITLATPHANPLYGFDTSIHQIHNKILLETTSATQQQQQQQQRREQQSSTKEDNDDDDLQASSPLIISISGGLRDEMIEASACEMKQQPRRRTHSSSTTVSVLTTHLMADTNKNQQQGQNQPQAQSQLLLGMDHRAIVWCHQVLGDVRKILWTLIINDHLSVQERREQIETLLGIEQRNSNDHSSSSSSYSYSEDVLTLHETMRQSYGRWYALCMESSMLYNLPHLFSLFVMIASIHSHFDPFHKEEEMMLMKKNQSTRKERMVLMHLTFQILPVVLVIILGCQFNDSVGFAPTVVMAFVADLINSFLIAVMPVGFLRKKILSLDTTTTGSGARNAFEFLSRMLLVLLIVIIIVALCLVCFLLPGTGIVGFFQEYIDSTLYICAIVMTYAILISWIGYSKSNRESAFDIQFIVLTMMTIPITAVGDIVLMIWEHTVQGSAWKSLLKILIPVGLLAFTKIQRACSEDPKDVDRSFAQSWRRRSIFFIVLAFAISPWVLSRGSGYLAKTVVEMIAWMDLALVYFSK